MTNFDIGHEKSEERPQSASVIIALLAAMLLVVMLVSYGPDANRPQVATGQECAAIGDISARLNCYDQLFERAAPEPAKGATAPLGSR
jgi:hypothetical protein